MSRAEDPFVGRAAELTAMAGAFARSSAGHPGLLSVEGPAGIGKTALLRAFLRSATPPVVISVSGDAEEITLAWGIMAQLVRDAPDSQDAPWHRLGELTADADPLGAGRLLLDGLGMLAADDPVLLVVEDLHWIDQPSSRALRFALRWLNKERVLAILTTRPEGPAQLDEGWRRLLDDRGQRLRLAPFVPAEVAQLARSLRDCTLSSPAAQRLCRHAGGNPLYTRWLIDELDPVVLRAASGPLPAPKSLATLLVARLAACPTETQTLVSAVAVLGEHCPLADAVTLAGVTAPADALGRALTAGLLVEHHEQDGTSQIQFPHPLVRAALYADLNPARRAALHLSAARLAAGASALAHRVAAASGPDAALAVELAQMAEAESAMGRYASAARHLISAAGLSADRQLREDRLLAACTVWLRAGAVHEVSARRELLDALPPTPQRDHLRGFLAHLEGRSQDARTALRAALDQLQAAGDGGHRAAEAASRLAGLAVYEWDWQTALTLVPQVPENGPALALLVHCIALTMGGRPTEARRALDTTPDRSRAGRGYVLDCLARGFVAAWSDDLTGAKTNLEAIARRPDGFGGSMRSAAHWLLADVYYRLGALGDATVTAELARSLLQDTGRTKSPEIAMAFAIGAYAASARGDWAEAEDCAAEARARAQPTASGFEHACAAAAEWSVAVALDHPARMLAAARAFDVSATAPELSIFPFGPLLAEALWRAGRLDEADARLAVYEARAGQLARASALVAAGRVRGLIEAGRHNAEAALTAFAAAAPMADELPRNLEAARFKAAYALVLQRLGRRAVAAGLAAEARAVLLEMGARPYLDRTGPRLGRSGGGAGRRSGAGQLTASESVVARLVASGLSNKEVASQLRVSRKAVEFHLANIYAKLGVSSRSQLAARAAALGPQQAIAP